MRTLIVVPEGISTSLCASAGKDDKDATTSRREVSAAVATGKLLRFMSHSPRRVFGWPGKSGALSWDAGPCHVAASNVVGFDLCGLRSSFVLHRILCVLCGNLCALCGKRFRVRLQYYRRASLLPPMKTKYEQP